VAGRDERLVAQPVVGRRELGVRVGGDLVGRLGELHVVRPLTGQLRDAQADQPVGPLVDDVVLGEDVDVLEHDVVPVRDQLAPALGPHVVERRDHQPEVAPPAPVGADVEHVAPGAHTVVDRVLVVLLAGQDELPGCRRLGRAQPADLARGEAPGAGEDQRPAARAPDAEPEERVRLLVEHHVVGHRRAPAVAPQPIRPLGVVLQHVEQGRRVRRPGDAADVLDALGRERSRHEVLDVERVVTETGEVERVGQPAPVVTHREGAQGQELVALGQRVQVERDLLGGIGRPLATVDRVLLAGLRPRVVEPAQVRIGHALVVLLDARQHLAVERGLERLGRLHHLVGVGVLGLEVGGDLGRVLVAQPVVLVLPDLAVHDLGPGDLPGDGRLPHYRRSACSTSFQ
jgi:hypothetical protein